MMLLERLFDGFKIALYGVKQSNHRITMLKLSSLPKVILIPTEILLFEW
ncbi:hypothetical protein CPS_4486 [Colwellia psychrerythraea 34H]|uniref:Uncharacterized protein n=1 Tax=Colwellia psychrerythraea (strain 34H / ATCC BAA-681) TaxID=167879 RepID=Q47VN8_COLP3|nr:hypothetical protein CPS_4486 [Colwellia psychrerythraea 34H]